MRTMLSEKRRKVLQNVSIENRVWIYDASIILEFLRSTFMPTSYFVKDDYVNGDFTPHIDRHFKQPLTKKSYLSIVQAYEYYLMFRQQRPYTSEIETRFKFGVILKKLSLRQHGWLIEKRRFGREQVVMVGPLMLRVQASPEDRTRFPVGGRLSTSVELSTYDAEDDESA